MDEGSEFRWPDDDGECAAIARSLFINACVEVARYWTGFGTGLVTKAAAGSAVRPRVERGSQAGPGVPGGVRRPHRVQRGKVLELLEQCVRGAVFNTLCTLDQFPHGEAEVWVQDGVCGEGRRRFPIAPTAADLHDEFTAAMQRVGRE